MSDDPIFDKAEYLRPFKFIPFKPPSGPAIPRQVRIRMKRAWENWLYAVAKDVNQKGVGTIQVWRDGRKIGTAPVTDHIEADRVYQDTIDAAVEATQEYEAELA